MTDTELKRRKAICDVAGIDDIGELSDGFHTFNGLYEQRLILFAALVKAYKDRSWKSYHHEDGEYCFGGGWFIVGIDTPEGSYTYHYENKYWDMFDCIDLPMAPHWDGHTEEDAEMRLMSLEPEIKTDGDTISRQAAIDAIVNTPTDVYSHDRIVSVLDGAAFRQNEIIDIINALPSVEPERKQGRWIEHYGDSKCSECGYVLKIYDTNYCPDCGSYNGGGRERMSDLNCTNCCIGDFKEELCDCNFGFCERFKGIGNQNDFMNKVLKQIPEWIPVSEGLPEDWKDVLVWFEYFRYGDYNRMYSTYGIGNYNSQYDSWLINHETGWKDLHVFAWMPLPEPPKMEGEQDESN